MMEFRNEDDGKYLTTQVMWSSIHIVSQVEWQSTFDGEFDR